MATYFDRISYRKVIKYDNRAVCFITHSMYLIYVLVLYIFNTPALNYSPVIARGHYYAFVNQLQCKQFEEVALYN